MKKHSPVRIMFTSPIQKHFRKIYNDNRGAGQGAFMKLNVLTPYNFFAREQQARRELCPYTCEGGLLIVGKIDCERCHNQKKYSRSILPIRKVCKPCLKIIREVLND